jgi:hypothetical protein
MDETMRKSLEVSADLILATLEDQTITREHQMKLMGLWHGIRKVIGYPTHYGL